MKLSHFTLRDLFWLVLVCALAVGWWLKQRAAAQSEAENASLREELTTARIYSKDLLQANADAIAAGNVFIAHLDKLGFDVRPDGPGYRNWRVERRSEKP